MALGSLRRIAIPLGILAVGLGASALLLSTGPKAERTDHPERLRTVRVAPARTEARRLRVAAQGTVEPRREIPLVVEVDGRIAWLPPTFASGGSFAEGDVLVRLDQTDMRDRLQEADAEFHLAQAEARQAAADLGRRRELAAREILSEAGLDDAVARRDVARARMRRAEALRSRAARDLERTEVNAPFAGRIRKAHVDLGQFVSRGTPLATIFATDVAEIRLPISIRDVDKLAIPASAIAGAVLQAGPPVQLSARIGRRHHAWTARVTRIEAALDAQDRTVVLVAEVHDPHGAGVSTHDLPLGPGLFVEAVVEGRMVDEAVVLPRAALADDERLAVVDEEDRLRLRSVRVAGWEDESAIVVGVQPGERICLRFPRGGIDGMRVSPVSDAQSEG